MRHKTLLSFLLGVEVEWEIREGGLLLPGVKRLLRSLMMALKDGRCDGS